MRSKILEKNSKKLFSSLSIELSLFGIVGYSVWAFSKYSSTCEKLPDT